MMRSMREYLKGKTVAIVGPAQSIEGSNNGELIDSHDVVVRLNYANIGNPKDSGTKTDIVYYDGSNHNYDNVTLEYLICSYPTTEWFFAHRCLALALHNTDKYKNRFKIIDKSLYNSIKTALDPKQKSRPNTGLIAIADLLSYNIKSLFITGLDFYRSSYAKEHPDFGGQKLKKVKKIFKAGDNGDCHDPERQFQYFKNKLYRDPRIKVDDFLKGYLD